MRLMAFVSDKTWDKNSCNCFTHKYRVRTRIALEIKQFYPVFILYAGIKKILFTLETPFLSRLPQAWRDKEIRFSARSSVRTSVRKHL